MSNPSKMKGTQYETEVCNFLLPHWPAVERRTLTGNKDRGDIAGVPGWALEAKNRKAMNLGVWVAEAIVEAANCKVRYWAVIHKRFRKSTADSYCTVPLWAFMELLSPGWVGPGDLPCDWELPKKYNFGSDVAQCLGQIWPAVHANVDSDRIEGVEGWYIEAKVEVGMNLDTWVRAAIIQSAKEGLDAWAIIHRRRLAQVDQSYVTISLQRWVATVSPRPAPLDV